MKPTDVLLERKGMPIYPWYISDLTSSTQMRDVFGFGIDKIFVYIEKGFLHGTFDSESANHIGKFFLDKLVNDKSFFKEVIDNIYKKSDDLNLFIDKVKKIPNTAELGNEELISFYDEYIDKLSILRVWGWIPVFVDGFKINFLTDYVISELTKFLRSKGLDNKAAEYYSVLSTSEKPSEVYCEMIDRLLLAKNIYESSDGQKIIELIKLGDIENLKNTAYFKKLEDHRKKYEWLTYSYAGPLMSMEYLLKVLAEDFSKNESIEEQYEIVSNRHDEIKKEKDDLIKELDLNEQLKYLFNISCELMYMKDWRKGVYQKSYVVMDKIIEEIAKRIGISLNEAKYIVIDEVRDALINNNLETIREKAKKRAELCCYLVTENKMEIWEGEECKKKIEEIVKIKTEEAKKETVLKGQIAYKGYVKGIAKIILVESDMTKLNEGEILISSSTNPDLILSMKKASAFVTDMGGITSHAAIVSRELKKPCVVGTKNATKMIKDGDLVEVNADKGIVTIIR